MKYNVLFITCDQLRRDALGIYGNQFIQTPNIDALFSRGVRFTNMFTAHPVCAPNRGVIATGRWPKVNGLVFNAYALPRQETTMMDLFRTNGYTTYGVGKMHFAPQWLSDWDENGKGAVSPQPPDWDRPWHGFDQCLITEDNRLGPYADYLKANGFDPWEDLHSFSVGKQHWTVASPYPEKHHQTTWITDRSLDFLKEHDKRKPFFMWVSYVHPHHPFNPPKPYDTMYEPHSLPLPAYREGEHNNRPKCFQDKFKGINQGHESFDASALKDSDWQKIKAYYYGMVSLIDKNIGRIVNYLKEVGEYEKTIFVFTNDHGEFLGDHHLLFKAFPFDCVTAMPFLVKTPVSTKLKEVPILCRSLEIMPTLLDLAGLPRPEFLNGISLTNYIDGNRKEELFEDILIEQPAHHTIRSKRYRLTIYHRSEKGELYDLEKDPDNFNNLWDDHFSQEIKESLISRLIEKMYTEIVDPRFQKKGMC